MYAVNNLKLWIKMLVLNKLPGQNNETFKASFILI